MSTITKITFSAALAAAFALGTATAPSANAASVQSEVLALTNQYRARAGCPALHLSGALNAAAQRHSQDMARRHYFGHTSPEGRDAGDRIAAAGYRARTWAENIARGQRSARAVVTGWWNSAGHRRNITNCAMRELGVGYTGGGSAYWTQNFAAR